jgi:hypothetical protein
VYISKIEAYAEFMGVGDALDHVMMTNCPTKMEFALLDVTNPTNGPLVELYKANKKLCTIIALGQGKNYNSSTSATVTYLRSSCCRVSTTPVGK